MKTFTLCIVLALSTILFGQSPEVQWKNSIVGGEAKSVDQTFDSGYIAAGLSAYNFSDFFLVRYNKLGQELWQKKLGGSAEDAAQSVQQTFDSGYIVVGYTWSTDEDVTDNHGGEDMWILKLSREGVVQWQKTLGSSSDEAAFSVRQTSDSGFIVAGHRTEANGIGATDILLYKLGRNGDVQWEKQLQTDAAEYCRSVRETADSGFILAATRVTNTTFANQYLIVRLDKNGNQQWEKEYGDKGNDEAFSASQCKDGGYIVGGAMASNQACVLKLDAAGEIEWQTYNNNPQQVFYEIRTIEQLKDGSYIAGGSGAIERSYRGFVSRIGALGNIIWLKPTDGVLVNYEIPSSIKPTTDSGYILASTKRLGPDVRGFVVTKYGPDRMEDVLPLNLLTFTAKKDQLGVLVQWETTSEKEVSHFIIQRSSDGINFNSIYSVKAKNNTNLDNTYSYVDASTAPGPVFYRLQTVDKNGVITFSKIVALSLNNASGLMKIYPNPAKSFIQVLARNVKTIMFVDVSGKTVLTKKATESDINRINIQSLAQGTYLVTVIDQLGNRHSQKIIKY